MTSRTGSPAKVVAAAEKAGAKITEHRLRNGMRVLLIERHLDPVVAVMLWYGVGARDEREDEAGMSHFLEHMMFKGSARFGKGEVDRITTELGGSNNAYTTADHTAYWFEFASDRWETALEIEADRMTGLSLDAAEFEAEKAVVLEELAMGKDDPWRSLTYQVQEMVFPRHPYRRPIIGYADVLERMSADDMRAYYERHYNPENATLVLCGDVHPEAALKVVRKHFGKIPKSTDDRIAIHRAPQLEPTGERRIVTTWDDPASRICIGWPTVSVATDEDFAFDLVSTILTTGRMSRLHRRLVLERGLATSIGSNNDARVDPGSFWLFAECAQGVAVDELQSAIDDEIAMLANEKVPAAELKRAKAVLSSSEQLDGETVSDLAEDIGGFAVDAHWRVAIESNALRERVTAKDVSAVVRRLLAPERRVVGWSVPREPA